MTESTNSQSPMSDEQIDAELARQLNILQFRTSETVPEDDFAKMLRKSIATGKPLRVKCGIDPTNPDVHLGHSVPYRKMRQFQDLGHTGVVIIGDYTASIGDPSGKNESRKSIDSSTVQENAKRYMEQLFTVLDESKTEVRFQSEWFAKAELRDIIGWAAQTTVAKLISHDTFKKRLDDGLSLSLHEMFYPVLQGIDSVYIEADVELGGTDQRFNVLMGRDYQKARGQRPQVAMLLPIITGTCGTQKMSKSLGNYIGILDEPFDKFGKVMSIPDELMVEYYTYCTSLEEKEIQQVAEGLSSGSLHPNETKKKLAEIIVAFFHGEEVAKQMRAQFEAVFKKGGVPEDTPDYHVGGGQKLIDILIESKLMASKGEARRMFKQNAVSIIDEDLNGEKVNDENMIIDSSLGGKVIKVGKRKFLRIKK